MIYFLLLDNLMEILAIKGNSREMTSIFATTCSNRGVRFRWAYYYCTYALGRVKCIIELAFLFSKSERSACLTSAQLVHQNYIKQPPDKPVTKIPSTREGALKTALPYSAVVLRLQLSRSGQSNLILRALARVITGIVHTMRYVAASRAHHTRNASQKREKERETRK